VLWTRVQSAWCWLPATTCSIISSAVHKPLMSPCLIIWKPYSQCTMHTQLAQCDYQYVITSKFIPNNYILPSTVASYNGIVTRSQLSCSLSVYIKPYQFVTLYHMCATDKAGYWLAMVLVTGYRSVAEDMLNIAHPIVYCGISEPAISTTGHRKSH